MSSRLVVLAACLVASTNSLPLAADTGSQTARTKGGAKGVTKGGTKGTVTKGVKAGGKRPATLDSQAGRASASAKGAPQDCKAMRTTQSRRNCHSQGAAAAAPHAALPLSPPADGPRRRVYIDAGANPNPNPNLLTPTLTLTLTLTRCQLGEHAPPVPRHCTHRKHPGGRAGANPLPYNPL